MPRRITGPACVCAFCSMTRSPRYLRAGRIGVFLRSIADLFTAKEALRYRGDNRVFWVYLKNSLFARG